MKRRTNNLGSWMVVAGAAAVIAGCGQTDPPSFRLDMRRAVTNQIVSEHQQAIADVLGAMFGTPDEPFAPPETGLDERKLQMAAGPVWSDEQGGKHGLYRRHCAHCHGISGDGLGPTAMLLNPYPRDYREGVFKFKSTFNPDRPTDEDLRTILVNGIPSTAMPSFALLPPDEIDALVEYVKYLSMRGQMETALVDFVADELDYDPITGEAVDALDPDNDAEQREIVMSLLVDDVVAGWEEAQERAIVPEAASLPAGDRSEEVIAESAAQGRELFYGTRANCVKCHGPTGLGDGQQDDHDNWNKANKQFIDDTNVLAASIESLKRNMTEMEDDELAQARDELTYRHQELALRREVIATLPPPRNAIPRNLRDGTYRGGRRPLDFYRRVHQGIAGTPMPAGGPAVPGAQGTLSEEEIWQLVDYIRCLPFEPASQPSTGPVNVEAVVN